MKFYIISAVFFPLLDVVRLIANQPPKGTMSETLVPSVPPVSPFEAYTIIIVLPFLMRLIFVAPPLVDPLEQAHAQGGQGEARQVGLRSDQEAERREVLAYRPQRDAGHLPPCGDSHIRSGLHGPDRLGELGDSIPGTHASGAGGTPLDRVRLHEGDEDEEGRPEARPVRHQQGQAGGRHRSHGQGPPQVAEGITIPRPWKGDDDSQQERSAFSPFGLATSVLEAGADILDMALDEVRIPAGEAVDKMDSEIQRRIQQRVQASKRSMVIGTLFAAFPLVVLLGLPAALEEMNALSLGEANNSHSVPTANCTRPVTRRISSASPASSSM